ncbi:MAG TPA: class I SAM-dependent methyltransferase [Gemmatimonadales bacterium]|jgi:SAM-dependent methyltransferase
MPRGKRYDRAYFDHWYRTRRIGRPSDLARSVAFAVAITEQLLGRPLRSVLDVGAGEGRWQPVLHRLRPDARYAGVDASRWAVERWGRRRNLRLGSIDALDELGLDPPFDLVVAADMLHYLPRQTLRAGLAQLAPLVGGVAFLPTFTSQDEIEGDRAEFQRRSAATYRALFQEAGLVPLGMHAWTIAAGRSGLAQLERP